MKIPNTKNPPGYYVRQKNGKAYIHTTSLDYAIQWCEDVIERGWRGARLIKDIVYVDKDGKRVVKTLL